MNALGPLRHCGWVLGCWLVLAFTLGTRADESHQPVFYEGQVGPYQARVVVRPPGVIPGLADISVRILSGQVEQVSALPIKWNAGKQGAPPPDLALPVRGDDALFATQLWFMESGAHGIEVTLTGRAGEGRVLVPVNSTATRVLNLPKYLGTILAGLGLLLVALLVAIGGAAVRESVLPPGEIPSRGRRWAARGAVAGTAALLATLLVGGWKWWGAEAADYRNNRLYRPRSLDLAVAKPAEGPKLTLTLDEPNPMRMPPLVPDHGRLMHVFLVQEPDLGSMAHLHPVRRNRKTFEAALPPLPAGEYTAYAQITHETGFTETLTNRVLLPSPASTPYPSPDSDPVDAWFTGTSTPGAARPEANGTDVLDAASLGEGWRMERSGTSSLQVRAPVSLRFRIIDPSGKPGPLEPYLGMLGHLALRSRDGSVFSHIHPSGSFSMAAQQLFALRETGEAPRKVNYGAEDPTCRLPSVDESTDTWMAQSSQVRPGEVSFPCEFVRPGPHRIWVQVQAGGRIRTGVFDLEVSPRK